MEDVPLAQGPEALLGPVLERDHAATVTDFCSAAGLLDTSADGTALAVADRAPVHAELNGIHVPTLVAVGADDVATPRTKMGRIAVAINGTRLEVVAGSGHSSPLEQSIALTTPLRDFLTSVGNR